ncbi:MAG: HRDC domain-containing protein [Treponema sp.]
MKKTNKHWDWSSGSTPDYKEVLKPDVFELFSYLRDERKKLAEQAGIPVYAVVTNAQLAQIAEKKPKTLECRESEIFDHVKQPPPAAELTRFSKT